MINSDFLEMFALEVRSKSIKLSKGSNKEKECNRKLRFKVTRIDCELRKVITDVDTRWNSTYFLLKPIHLLRPALESIREGRYEDEKTNPDFKAKIPSALTFQIIDKILPIMQKADVNFVQIRFCRNFQV